MSSNKSTPQKNSKKKRPMCSPSDMTEPKKTKPVSEKDFTGFVFLEDSEAGVPPTQFT